jgi:hypothetical protein
VRDPLPLAAAQARLGRPGRPRKQPEKGDTRVTAPPRTRMSGGENGSALAVQAGALAQAGQVSALLPRLLTVPAASAYLSLSEDVVLELMDAGTFMRVTVPAPVTAKRRGGVIRRVLFDRLQLDAAVDAWSRGGCPGPA